MMPVHKKKPNSLAHSCSQVSKHQTPLLKHNHTVEVVIVLPLSCSIQICMTILQRDTLRMKLSSLHLTQEAFQVEFLLVLAFIPELANLIQEALLALLPKISFGVDGIILVNS
jgi:hypothetical protein